MADQEPAPRGSSKARGNGDFSFPIVSGLRQRRLRVHDALVRCAGLTLANLAVSVGGVVKASDLDGLAMAMQLSRLAGILPRWSGQPAQPSSLLAGIRLATLLLAVSGLSKLWRFMKGGAASRSCRCGAERKRRLGCRQGKSKKLQQKPRHSLQWSDQDERLDEWQIIKIKITE